MKPQATGLLFVWKAATAAGDCPTLQLTRRTLTLTFWSWVGSHCWVPASGEQCGRGCSYRRRCVMEPPLCCLLVSLVTFPGAVSSGEMEMVILTLPVHKGAGENQGSILYAIIAVKADGIVVGTSWTVASNKYTPRAF